MGRSWSYADDRRVIELAKASMSLEEAARIMKRTPARIRQVSTRLGVSFKATGKTGVVKKEKAPKEVVALTVLGLQPSAGWVSRE